MVKQYPQFWSTDIHNFDQQISTILKHKYQQIWSTNIHNFEYLNINHILIKQYPQFWSTSIHNSDQHLYTIWPNFQTSTLGVSKFDRTLVDIPTKIRHWGCRSLVEVWRRSLVGIWSNTLILQCCLIIYRTSFDQTSTLEVSEFGRSLVGVSTKTLPNFDTGAKVWARFLPNLETKQYIQFWSTCNYNFDPTVITILINIYSQAWSNNIHNVDQNVYTILIKIYTQVWSNNIHKFVQTISKCLTITCHQFWSIISNLKFD